MTPKCCDLPANTVAHSSCFAIPIPRNDPFYTRFGQECLEFVRSSPATNVLGPREQLNQLTSFIDGMVAVQLECLADVNGFPCFSFPGLWFNPSNGQYTPDVQYGYGDNVIIWKAQIGSNDENKTLKKIKTRMKIESCSPWIRSIEDRSGV